MGRPSLTAAVLFDLDGTLIDTYRLYLESYRRALEPVFGRALSDEEIIALRPVSERAFLVDLLGEPEAAETHAEFCRYYEEFHDVLCEGMYEGVREMLAALRSASIPLGIVTGKGRTAWELTARRLGLESFDAVVTESDVARPKPDPEGLRLALEQLSIAPESAVYIGDSISDLEAGRRAGMAVAAALWPKTGPGEKTRFQEAVGEHAPEWLFERPADVSRTFAPWC